MLSKPAAGSRQPIGLCLSKNIELDRNQEALTRASPSGTGRSAQGSSHLPLPPDTHTIAQGPFILPVGKKHFTNAKQQQEGAGMKFSLLAKPLTCPCAPVNHAFIREALFSGLYVLGTEDGRIDKTPSTLSS